MSHCEIPLRGGGVALVSPEDLEELSNFEWVRIKNHNTFYAIRYIYPGGCKNGKKVWMHRQILGLTDPRILGDHRNGNGLDNRRRNIRVATSLQNHYNIWRQKSNTVGLKGVSYIRRDRRFRSAITVDGKRRSLGYFVCPLLAFVAYCRAARAGHGEFVNLGLTPKDGV